MDSLTAMRLSRKMAEGQFVKQVVIYSKPGCHLCEDAAAQLLELQQAHTFDLGEVNILSDPATFEKFKHDIPVVFIDGQESSRRYFDERQFLEQLEKG